MSHTERQLIPTLPACKRCNGEGLVPVETGSHWDVHFEVCGSCDGDGNGVVPQTEQR